MEGSRAIWLDCDPGHDDAIALILACHSGVLIGVSTTAGNQTLAKTTRNAIRVVRCIGCHNVPVLAGVGGPLLAKGLQCPEIHGESGLGLLPEDEEVGKRFMDLCHSEREAVQENGILGMRNRIIDSKVPVTLVATGCLTNVALLIKVFPEVLASLDRIIFLGGTHGAPVGNISPAAEFNVLLDPHAAQIVFHQTVVPVYQIPLSVTHTAIVRDSVVSRLPESEFGALVKAWMRFFAHTYADVFGMSEGPPLHDPLAVAMALRPSLFESRFLNVEVECSSGLSFGQTIVDEYQSTGRPANVHVATKVDTKAFWDLVIEAINTMDKSSVL